MYARTFGGQVGIFKCVDRVSRATGWKLALCIALAATPPNPLPALALPRRPAAHVPSVERPESVTVEHNAGANPMIDRRHFERGKIPEPAVPPGTVILYRLPRGWHVYSNYIAAGIALNFVQVLLIFGLLWGLLWQRAR